MSILLHSVTFIKISLRGIQKNGNKMRKPISLQISYQTMAEILGTSPGNVRLRECRGEFDIKNLESVILFLAANIILRENRKLPADTNNQGMNKAS